MPIEIIAELATGHGGDLDLAKRMIDAAATAGADMVKTQAYRLEQLNPADPQADWLRQSHLTEDDHVVLLAHAREVGIKYFASAFDHPSAEFIMKLCGAVKFASSVEVLNTRSFGAVFKTFPWRVDRDTIFDERFMLTVPLYPTPVECLAGVAFDERTGWSDHCVGIGGAIHAYTKGARLFEMHLTIPGARHMPWDKTPEDITRFRSICEDLETAKEGVSKTFRERWQR